MATGPAGHWTNVVAMAIGACPVKASHSKSYAVRGWTPGNKSGTPGSMSAWRPGKMFGTPGKMSASRQLVRHYVMYYSSFVSEWEIIINKLLFIFMNTLHFQSLFLSGRPTFTQKVTPSFNTSGLTHLPYS